MRSRALALVRQLFSGTTRAVLSPFGDRLGSQRIQAAPIVSAQRPGRVLKLCQTVSYTISGATVSTACMRRSPLACTHCTMTDTWIALCGSRHIRSQ
jgi:hypothetical protein